MPPSKAKCTAMLLSVTVSMGDDINGVLSVIVLVNLDVKLTALTGKNIYPQVELKNYHCVNFSSIYLPSKDYN